MYHDFEGAVREFHQKFGLPEGFTGSIPDDGRALLLVRLMCEELTEVVEAIQLKDYVNLSKELADLLYVVFGTAIEYGVPIGEVFAAVHNSNMTKTAATDSGGKIIKGETYEAPDIAAVLEAYMQNKGR